MNHCLIESNACSVAEEASKKNMLVKINSNGKIRTYVCVVLQKLQNYKEVVVTSSGIGINKLVSVVEIVKNEHGSLNQQNSIGFIKDKPTVKILEKIKPTKHKPYLTIRLFE